MKVVISIPDPVFRAAESATRRMRVPQSQFYARAVEAYLREQERPDVTERLNQVYGRKGRGPDAVILRHAVRMLRRVEWEE